jgi:hypothetical protein
VYKSVRLVRRRQGESTLAGVPRFHLFRVSSAPDQYTCRVLNIYNTGKWETMDMNRGFQLDGIKGI